MKEPNSTVQLHAKVSTVVFLPLLPFDTGITKDTPLSLYHSDFSGIMLLYARSLFESLQLLIHLPSLVKHGQRSDSPPY